MPFPSPGDLPDPGIKLGSPALQADSLPSEPQSYYENSHTSLSVDLFFLLLGRRLGTELLYNSKYQLEGAFI